MATAVVAEPRKLPRPGRGGVVLHGLSEEEARVTAIAEIVNNMVELSQKGENVDSPCLPEIRTLTRPQNRRYDCSPSRL
ncbi:hypothetical protein LguiA_000765 [Lonicera macranthoides]